MNVGKLSDIIRGVVEGWQDPEMQSKLGPDWRQKLAEAEAQRGDARRKAREEADAAGLAQEQGKLSIGEKLKQAVADMMEGQSEQTPSAGKINVAGEDGGRGFDMNLPDKAAVPPNYEETLPTSALNASGLRAKDIVAGGKGKMALSRKQLQVLRGEQDFRRASAAQTFRENDREDRQVFGDEQAGKTRGFKAGQTATTEAGKNARQRDRLRFGATATGLKGSAEEDARALRDFQAGKITAQQLQDRRTASAGKLPDPFAEAPADNIPDISPDDRAAYEALPAGAKYKVNGKVYTKK